MQSDTKYVWEPYNGITRKVMEKKILKRCGQGSEEHTFKKGQETKGSYQSWLSIQGARNCRSSMGKLSLYRW